MSIYKDGFPGETNAKASILAHLARFLRGFWLRLLMISAGLIIPCFWHAHIEAGDLGSHVYNAWLAHQITTGQAPGLWLAPRSNNVLFDLVLSGLGNIEGWWAAEKIATCGAVLIFFWGALTLVCAVTRRLPWSCVPCLAIVSYGWSFEMGFMNFYISLGLAFFALAIVIRANGWERAWAAILVPLIWLAHPLGLALLIGVGAYVALAEQLPPRRRFYPFVMAALLLFGMHFLLLVCFPDHVTWTQDTSGSWSHEPRVIHDGIDQLVLYGPHYFLPARLFRALIWGCLLLDLLRPYEPRSRFPYILPLELYTLTLLGAALLPTAIQAKILEKMGFVSIAFLTERLTTVSVVFLVCLLGVMKPQKWHVAGFGVIAVIFFFFLYHDTGTINGMEDEVRRCLQTIPAGQRVVGAIQNINGSRVSVHHIVARACIGHCFDYDNYEAATRQFRVRAPRENPYMLTDAGDCHAAAVGKYVVRPTDLPLFEVEQYGSNLTAMTIRKLVAGETNGHAPIGGEQGEGLHR